MIVQPIRVEKSITVRILLVVVVLIIVIAALVDSNFEEAFEHTALVEEQDWPDTPLFVNEQTQDVLKRFLDDAQHVAAIALEKRDRLLDMPGARALGDLGLLVELLDLVGADPHRDRLRGWLAHGIQP